MNDFTKIDYLKSGNKRQRQAYKVLKKIKILDHLRSYNPILTGTIPIDIDLTNSDLDIICECKNYEEFYILLTELFANEKDFQIRTINCNNVKSILAKFRIESFEIEIFGQNIPTQEQNAYKHMMIEYKILKKMGAKFKTDIRKLKKEGLKTEPAFAKLLGLTGNPYEELLKVQI
ncbi:MULTISPECIES: DUF4269 domain-containing protein [Aquimarina]|uniref:DUF4269 domain-containing protein n=1 Tax=Aquimarina algiphila TaxID=2047982 RepID=A0A554VKB4_9FLAO|nr:MULTISPECIES: DUF4269 domain-containing protein [Aquimarina]TSE08479.1 DUF4269 domain-containing protein [Aquimarina algiphila]